jgi:hypothetical protein
VAVVLEGLVAVVKMALATVDIFLAVSKILNNN